MGQDGRVRDVEIRDGTIRLGQLLKLAGVIDNGSEARGLLDERLVRVNGDVETRRGRQLHAGDEVAVGDDRIRLTSPE